jgi:GNAT superfamily N-acetyltransferase
MAVHLEEFSADYAAPVVELVHGILREEFGFAADVSQQPDLLDIPRHYGAEASKFWLALDGTRLVGTTGFVDLGSKQGLLRKMFVRGDYRGTGVASLLLDNAVQWAREHRFLTMYLGTNSNFHAARRFYEKHGFVQLAPESLPAAVPRLNLRDRFYCRTL